MSDDTSHLINLLQRISQEDEKALEELYNCTVKRIYGMARKFVVNPDLAEEVVSDVFMQVWEQAERYTESKAAPMGWLLMICRSRALDKLRREKKFTEKTYSTNEENPVEDPHAEEPIVDMMDHELSKEVIEALEQLSVKQRQALCLVFYKGMSHKEIASYTGDPLGTVKSNLRRAQEVLRGSLLEAYKATGGLHGNA
ncbi:MAG: Unknown protein [uncultured Thiotrichaceae bacterium]|uniref:RNA polymerase subunit sigma-24 n=1 Tax=uncultured Thiotrichaceae bacterium TaxID=298394 RepID=A0A6S6TVE0_9GAMM|nr:MAG: Unknown protein [uncultured Thiotrichaceae bacterium]